MVLGDKTFTIDLLSVVRVRPMGQTFLKSFDGAIDLGASCTKSSGVGQGTFSAAVEFRRPSFEASTRFDSTVTIQSESPVTSRNRLQFNYGRFFRNRWTAPGIGQFENNSDLGLRLRSTIGGGVGYAICGKTARSSSMAARATRTGSRCARRRRITFSVRRHAQAMQDLQTRLNAR